MVDRRAAAAAVNAMASASQHSTMRAISHRMVRSLFSVGAMRGTLSKQHSPTPQHEAEHSEQRRHDVDGDEHPKHHV